MRFRLFNETAGESFVAVCVTCFNKSSRACQGFDSNDWAGDD
jgi:hypothetical protein